MSKLRAIIVRLLSWYFDSVKLSESFKQIAQEPAGYLIITQSDTALIEALLISFAKRSNLKTSQINWASLRNLTDITRQLHARPGLRLSTLNIFSERGPVRNNPKYNFPFWQRVNLLLKRRFVLIIFGEPIQIDSDTLSNPRKLTRKLKLDFYGNLKLVRGIPFQPIDVQADSVLSGTEYSRDIGLVAARLGEPPSRTRQRAKHAFYQMAANPRGALYTGAAVLCRFIINRLFSDVQTIGIDRLKAAVRDNTVVIVPMHRSHLDYILLGYKLYEANLNPPIIAAGVNLSFWPFGFLIRSVGGYFVKREARADRIHALVLRRYLSYLVKRGHLQEFFIEGGRSRSGRMRPPKIGLLSIIVDAYLRDRRKDILFVPAAFTYENVVEDRVFGEENTGRSKQRESLVSLLKVRKIFGKKYGEAILHFGEPLSLRATLERYEQEDASGQLGDERRAVQRLALAITRKIQKQSGVSLTGLAYLALMMAKHYGATRAELSITIRNLAKLTQIIKDVDPDLGEFTPSLNNFLAGKEGISTDIARSGVASIAFALGQELIYVPGKSRFTADFYRNSVIHIFLMPALFAATELVDGFITINRLREFHAIFGYEFHLRVVEKFCNESQTLIDRMLSRAILEHSEQGYRFKTRTSGIFIPSALQSYIQSFLWIYDNLSCSNLEAPSNRGQNQTISYKELLDRLQSDFRTAVYGGRFSRTEAASNATITSSLETLKARQIIAVDQGSDRQITLLRRPTAEIELLRATDRAISAFLL